MDMNQYTLFLPLDEKFESEELSLSYIVRLMFSVFQYRAAFFGKKIKKTDYFDDAYHMFDKLTI